MNRSINKETLINVGFYGGLVIKAITSLLEFFSGFMMIVLSHDWLDQLIRLVASSELSEDPKDIVMNYLINLGQNFSISKQHAVAFYLLLHGATKLVVILLLLKKKLWAYPFAVGVFGLFITYEIYGYLHSHSILLLLNVIIDIVIIIMVVLEYFNLKQKEQRIMIAK